LTRFANQTTAQLETIADLADADVAHANFECLPFGSFDRGVGRPDQQEAVPTRPQEEASVSR
jgi:hypothetical protein